MDLTLIENYLPQVLQYACRHWKDHAEKGEMALDDHGCIHRFLQKHFLHWLESMSLMGRITEAAIVLTKLTAMTDVRKSFLSWDVVNADHETSASSSTACA